MNTAVAVWEAGERYRVAVGDHHVVIDQPLAEGGGDAGMSPAELVPAALAGCIAHSVGVFLTRHDLDCGGLAVEVDAEIAPDPRRMARFAVRVRLPEGVPEKYLRPLERVANACTVGHTLRNAAEIAVALA